MWALFEHPDIEAYTSSVLTYVTFYIDSVTSSRQVKTFCILFTVYTHDCVATRDTNTVIKLAADTTMVRLISNEGPDREEVQRLVARCSDNHLNLSTRNTKEIIIDFQKLRTTMTTGLSMNGEVVERVTNFKLLSLLFS